MITSIQAQLNDWQYGRGIIKLFLNELSDSELDQPLPRKGLNTIRKQCLELTMIQACYVNALKTGMIAFSTAELSHKDTKTIIKDMDDLDNELNSLLENITATMEINWFGEMQNIHQHLSAMIGHEQMHIGQIVAFCYAVEVSIPTKITNAMSLNG